MKGNNAVNTEKTAYIFGAAPIGSIEHLIHRDGFIIAADGGLNATEALGLKPTVILGDFDSLGFIPKGDIVRHPVEKDDTDMGLAVKKALSLGYKRLFLFGGMGGARPDHTVANLQTLVYAAKNGATAYLTDGTICFTAVTGENRLTFPKAHSGELSIFSAEGIAEGVNIQNAKYTADNVTLSGDFPLGVSNSFLDEKTDTHGNSSKNTEISLKKGTLWVCFRCENKTDDTFPTIINL